MTMADITVREVADHTYQVVVDEGESSSVHQVTVAAGDLDGLHGAERTSDLIEASFRFLLDREPKESILTKFELGVISRYFSEYRDRLSDYL